MQMAIPFLLLIVILLLIFPANAGIRIKMMSGRLRPTSCDGGDAPL